MSNIKKLTPFKFFCLTNFPFIEEDFDALTYYQLLCKIVEYLNNVISTTNAIGTQTEELTNAFNELKNYVDNYFTNLDVQEEINNKLDQMAQDGTLTDIIAQYLQLSGILAFDTLADLKNATNITNGSFARTYSENAINDGKGAFYKIRNIQNTDVVDNNYIVALANPNLVAEKMKNYKEEINELDTVNIFNFSDKDNKTGDISEIINNNKKVFINNNSILNADDNAFIKENMKKIIKNGYYITPSISSNLSNIIQERNLKIKNDMILPSEFVNNIMWEHQRQSWNWDPAVHWNMQKYNAIVPWFQFNINPNYRGNKPDNFNIYIGKIEAFAYDLSNNNWKEVYNNYFENIAYFNYYTNGDSSQNGEYLSFSEINNYRVINVEKTKIEQSVLHGWLGDSEKYIPSNINYKYLIFRIPVYTNAPYGYIGVNLGLDLKNTNDNTIQEQCGSRTKIVTNTADYIYLTNVEPNNFDKYINNNIFKIFENNTLNNINNRYIFSGYIEQESKEFILEPNSFYFLSFSNIGGGNVTSVGYRIVATGNSGDNEGNIQELVGVDWVNTTLTGLTLKIEPKNNSYLTISVIKI